jgi:hypothetical protein
VVDLYRDTVKLREPPNDVVYQGDMETCHWRRSELRYGKNHTYNEEYHRFLRQWTIRNQVLQGRHPARDLLDAVQRLNVGGLERTSTSL